MKAGGIVLCGGMSTRMGEPKALLPFGSELLIQRVVRLVGEVVRPLVVAAAPGQRLPELPAEVQVVRDQRQGRGPLEGIYAGLSAIASQVDAAFVSGCDAPLLAPALVRRMLDLLEDHDVAVPVEGDLHHPLAAVYHVRVLPHIERLRAAHRLRPVFLFEQVDTRRVPAAALVDVDPQLHSLRNVNRPADYVAALEAAGLPAPAGTARRRRPEGEPGPSSS